MDIFSKLLCMFGLVHGLGWYSGTHESIIWALKKTPEQIWLLRAFFHSSNHRRQLSFLSDLHTAAPHIVTRPWPNWFLFSFNIPLELPFLSAPLLEQNFKKEETGGGKNARLRTLRGSTKVCGEETKRAPLWGYRKVKIINVDSVEALRMDKEGKTLHFGSAEPSWRDKLI